jgi:aminopeptidase
MHQSKLQRLANQFLSNAIQIRSDDNIWIEHRGPKARILAEACAAEARVLGAKPLLVDSGSAIVNSAISGLSDDDLTAFGLERLEKMQTMQAYIRVDDDADYAKVTLNADERIRYQRAVAPMTNYRINNTNWLVVAAPTEEFAAACGMNVTDFERFYCNVCLADYTKMRDSIQPLVDIMSKAHDVRVVSNAQQTDLMFSKEGISAVPCTGERNIPDGECFTAPKKYSVNGTIVFGPSKYLGHRFASLKLVFENGRVAAAEAENSERTAMLNKILDTDEGARFVGEFSIGFHPEIKNPIGNILFDEKIDGSIHMAMGKCYAQANNHNKSDIHWDMIHIQRQEYGGGEIFMDGRLIRKDGRFVVPELWALNPENLKTTLVMD